MKLQFVVVETGERWRRALLRMVLDQKLASHHDYGSFHASSQSASLHLSLDEEDHEVHEEPGVGGGEMTRDQRQPLLPASHGGDGWKQSASPTIEYFDEAPLATRKSSGGSGADQPGSGVGGGSGGPGGAQPAHSVVQIDVPSPARELHRFPQERWKAVIAFAVLVGSFILTTCSLALVHERVPAYPPLPDIILDAVDKAPWALDASEIIIMCSTSLVGVLIVFHKHKWIVMRRVFFLLALLYLMRSLTMFVTVLPMADVSYHCSAKANGTSAALVAQRVWKLMTGFGLSINGKHVYCGDFIYSGHTVILVMSYLIIAEYSPRRCYLLQWLQFLTSCVGIVFVLLARGHYTVDVLIAYYVTTTLFWSYHTLANNPQLKHSSPNNFLARHWWFVVFLYLERNVEGTVPRLYEWPLPWPRRCVAKHPNRNS